MPSSRRAIEIGTAVALALARWLWRGATVSAALSVACGTPGGSGSEERTFSNVGTMCLYPISETETVPGFGPPSDSTNHRTYPADQPVNIAVNFPACLSSSCSVDPTASCSASFESGNGGHVIVNSHGSYSDEKPLLSGCTADCRRLVARCTSPVLGAGTYTFEHGGTSTTLAIPFTGPPPCVDTQGR